MVNVADGTDVDVRLRPLPRGHASPLQLQRGSRSPQAGAEHRANDAWLWPRVPEVASALRGRALVVFQRVDGISGNPLAPLSKRYVFTGTRCPGKLTALT